VRKRKIKLSEAQSRAEYQGNTVSGHVGAPLRCCVRCSHRSNSEWGRGEASLTRHERPPITCPTNLYQCPALAAIFLATLPLELSASTHMNVLIDYDNVGRSERTKGLRHIVETVFSRLPPNLLHRGAAASVRLYGGWYKQRRMSKVAERLNDEIKRSFPTVVPVRPHGPGQNRTRVELARSLAIDPKTILSHTYRPRAAPTNLRPKHLPFRRCTQKNNCPLRAVHDLLRDNSCPNALCPVTVADTMSRPEQKLVDTMLAVDIVHAASVGRGDLVVVTTDDDLWPGIRMALYLGARVHHVHPRRHRRTPRYYSDTVAIEMADNYTQYSL